MSLDVVGALQKASEWAEDRGSPEKVEVAGSELNVGPRYWLIRVTWPAKAGFFPSRHYLTVDRETGTVERFVPPGTGHA